MTSRDPLSKKFVNARGTFRSKRTRGGVAGPSRYSRLSLHALAERLVEQEDVHDRLIVANGRVPEKLCPPKPPKNVVGMLAGKRDNVAKRVAVLLDVLDSLMIERCSTNFNRPEVARLMAAKLKEKVSLRSMYREPYGDIIDDRERDADHPVVAYNDTIERVRRHARQPRASLIHQLLQIEPLIAALVEERNLRLVSEAPDLVPLALVKRGAVQQEAGEPAGQLHHLKGH